MPNNHGHEIRECYQQAKHCAEQADAQSDPKVKKQFLELTRLWLILARGYDGVSNARPIQPPIEAAA